MTGSAPPKLSDTVTYLEMTAKPVRPPTPIPAAKLALMWAERCTVSFYRYLYDVVGEPWLWYERRLWSVSGSSCCNDRRRDLRSRRPAAAGRRAARLVQPVQEQGSVQAADFNRLRSYVDPIAGRRVCLLRLERRLDDG